jgi:hypothetical protein
VFGDKRVQRRGLVGKICGDVGEELTPVVT